MAKTFQALSALLCYPSADLKAASDDIAAVLASEAILSPKAQQALQPLLCDMKDSNLYDLQERYVLLFDRSRTLSLNLFEHVHGESRDRGSAMVDLLETYRAGGVELASNELPDHLPVLLEYLSTRDLDEARALLTDAGHVIQVLAERLLRRESPYAAVMTALLDAAHIKASRPESILTEPDEDPQDLARLDAEWEEAEVTFGPNPGAGCPASRDILSRMDPGVKPGLPRTALTVHQ